MTEWLKNHNILLRIVSLFIAILIWFFVIAQINPDMESRVRGIDVVITDVDHLTANGLAIVDGGNETIDVRIRGKRDKLVLVEADKFNVTASAAQITVPGTYKLDCNAVVDVDGVTVISKKPSQITIVVDRVSSKTVQAEIEFTGKMPSQYILENYSLSPDAIVVKGPQSQLEKVKKAIIKYNVDSLNRTVETSLSYILVDSKNAQVDMTELTVDTPAIVLKASVKAVKEVPLKVDLISHGMFSQNIAKCSINPEKITIIGDPEIVKFINSISLGTVNIMSYITSGVENISYDINIPNGVYSEDSPKSAEVSVITPGYSIGEITVSADRIQPVEGYSYLHSNVTFKVFGRTEALNGLSEDALSVYPTTIQDVNDTEIKVVLSASVNNPEVVIFGDYSITATKISE